MNEPVSNPNKLPVTAGSECSAGLGGLRTLPNAGTYYPPKIMCGGRWKYLVEVMDWHNHEHDAMEAHRYRKALEIIRDGFWSDGESAEEQVDYMKRTAMMALADA